MRVRFVDEMPDDARPEALAALSTIETHPSQSGFSLPAPVVLERSWSDPSRRAFAVLVHDEHADHVVGVGVLQSGGAGHLAWPEQTPHVMLRGFSIDARWQGRGIGTAATSAAVGLAQRAFPEAEAVVLTVHVDNVPGQRAYERAGFTRTGGLVHGRAGQEYVMVREL